MKKYITYAIGFVILIFCYIFWRNSWSYIPIVSSNKDFEAKCKIIGEYSISLYLSENDGNLPLSLHDLEKYYGEFLDYKSLRDINLEIVENSEKIFWVTISNSKQSIGYMYIFDNYTGEHEQFNSVSEYSFNRACKEYARLIVEFVYGNLGLFPASEDLLCEIKRLNSFAEPTNTELKVVTASESNLNATYLFKEATNSCYIMVMRSP